MNGRMGRWREAFIISPLLKHEDNQSTGSTERGAVSSQFFLLCGAFAKKPIFEIWFCIKRAPERWHLLPIAFSSSDYCWIPECFFFSFCEASIFTEGTKPHGGCTDYYKEIVSLFSFGDTLLLFLPPCKWINFLRLIWLMFSIIHRRTFQHTN